MRSRRPLLSAMLAITITAGLAWDVALAAAPAVASSMTVATRTTVDQTIPSVAVDLYRPGDFVSQTNLVQCVGASMQMMLNMVRGADDRAPSTQQALFELARSLRDPAVPSNPNWRGASAAGWASGLTLTGGGPYAVRSAATIEDALLLAATAITATGRPVGLLMWQGAHAWVMSGFEAAGGRPVDGGGHVTAVRVLDPLYPRVVGGTWGPGPAPDARLTVAQLARVFVPYRPHSRNATLRNRFVLVLPLRLTPAAPLRSLAA